MPKLIVNIEDRIFLSAKELFYEKGYEQVNMKEISARADIAVGTLYNYYSNKNQLYFLILENSWRGTFEKLDQLLALDMDGKEKLKASISLIYEEVLERKCMGVQIRKSKDLRGNKLIEDIEKEINKNIKKLFKNLDLRKDFIADRNILDKLVNTLLVNLTMIIEFYPEDKEENIRYLYAGIVGYFQ